MRKFRFRLEVVEKMRKTREQEALRILAEAQRDLLAEKNAKMALLSVLDESLQRRESFGVHAMTSNVVQLEESFISGTKIRIEQTDRSILRATKNVEKATAYYLVCRQKRMMMEKLRERALDRFKEEVRKRELKEMDDLNVMRARMEKGAA